MRKRITSLLLVLGMLSMLVPALAEGPTKLPKPTVQWLTESTVIEGVRCSAGEAILTDIPQDILPNFRMVL